MAGHITGDIFMTYHINGLQPEDFKPLFDLTDEELNMRDMVRVRASAKPGFPCRISLVDAEPGETLILLNYESHDAATPYRSQYAIYVREAATQAAEYAGAVPPVLQGRPLAFRHFDVNGMLQGASLVLDGEVDRAINTAFARSEISYIHAHNAAHGCFVARIDRA